MQTSTHTRLKQAMPVGIFTACYVLAAAVWALGNGNGEFLFYIIVMLLLAAVVAWVHVRIGLTRGVLFALSFWGLLHMLGGLVPVPAGWPINGDIRVLYSLWLIPDLLKYDHIVHAYGFGTATIVCWQGLRSLHPTVRPGTGALALCVLAAMGLGAVNEIVEFVAVLLIPDTNVGGYINTGWDLVANTAGALIAAISIRMKG